MAEKPILFSTPMVQAIQDGRKSMTRRVTKPQPDHFHRDIIGKPQPWDKADFDRLLPQIGDKEIKAPYQVGDVLWVREGVWVDPPSGVTPSPRPKDWDDWSETRKEAYIEGQARAIYIAQLHHVDSLIKAFAALWDSLNARPKPIYATIDREKVIVSYVSYPFADIQETRTYRGKPWQVVGNPYVFAYGLERIGGAD